MLHTFSNSMHSVTVVSLLIVLLDFLITFSNDWVHCRACSKTLELSSGSAHVNLKTFQSQQIGASWGLYGSGGLHLYSVLYSFLISLFFSLSLTLSHPFILDLVIFSHTLIFFPSFLFFSSPPPSVPAYRASPPLPSSLMQFLACCHVHATGRSRLTDGWMARAEAIRHWPEWNRTGPMHYQDSRLCLNCNLYFSGAGWQRTLSMFEQNPVLLCFRSAVTFWIPALSLHQGTCHILGRWSTIRRTYVFFFFFPMAWQVPTEEMDPNWKCHHILWNKIAAVMWPRFCKSLR